jgi:hypothetical protein
MQGINFRENRYVKIVSVLAGERAQALVYTASILMPGRMKRDHTPFGVRKKRFK